MTPSDAADQLQTRLTAFTKLPKARQTRDSGQFHDLNLAIRDGLRAVGEDSEDLAVLEARGLASGAYGDPIPDSYVPGVKQLIADLKAL